MKKGSNIDLNQKSRCPSLAFFLMKILPGNYRCRIVFLRFRLSASNPALYRKNNR